MPLGSSSDAPVISPGPSFSRRLRPLDLLDVRSGGALAAALCDLFISETFLDYRVRFESCSVTGLQSYMQVKAEMKDGLYGILLTSLRSVRYLFVESKAADAVG
jgi:hypothetical protein